MKKFNLLLIVAIFLGLFSCEKTNVEQDELTADVKFNLLVEENTNLETGQLKSDPLNRDVITDEIKVAVKSMKIVATHPHEVNERDYDVVDDGTGETSIEMNNLPLGSTNFTVTTDSYVENWHTDPQGWECDGFSSGTSLDIDYGILKTKWWWPFNESWLNPITSEDLADALRVIPPFVQFEGHKTEVIKYCEEGGDCNQIDIDMKAKQGRMIATVTFENESLSTHFYAKCTYTHNADNSPAPSRITEIKLGLFPVEAWFYLTNENVVEGVECVLKIEIFDREDNLVRTHIIDASSKPDEMIVENGIDKWLNVIITDEGLRQSCNTFNFTWEWENQDDEIEI